MTMQKYTNYYPMTEEQAAGIDVELVKPYLLYFGPRYYPSQAGIDDLHSSYDTLEACQEACNDLLDEVDAMAYVWYKIIHHPTMQIVEEGEADIDGFHPKEGV